LVGLGVGVRVRVEVLVELGVNVRDGVKVLVEVGRVPVLVLEGVNVGVSEGTVRLLIKWNTAGVTTPEALPVTS